jgi:hypothetical protein
MCGWIKIHRSIVDHWLYTEKRTFSKFEAWHDILIMVNFTDAKAMIKGKLYDIKRGQSILSLESWGKRWNWDKSKVRRFMNALQSDSMIVLESDNITTRLTVCKYETYQSERNANETPVKRKRNANEHQTTPIKEREELKNEEQKEENKRFIKPTIEDIKKEFPNFNAEHFYNYYESNGWMVGRNKMKDWKSTVKNWIAKDYNQQTQVTTNKPKFGTLNDD